MEGVLAGCLDGTLAASLDGALATSLDAALSAILDGLPGRLPVRQTHRLPDLLRRPHCSKHMYSTRFYYFLTTALTLRDQFSQKSDHVSRKFHWIIMSITHQAGMSVKLLYKYLPSYSR
jgi:hypothetical protein